MINLQGERILITGGNKGLGRAIVTELVSMDAKVTVIVRNKIVVSELAAKNISIMVGNVTDKAFMDKIIGELKPTLLILNAGATPLMTPIDEQDWESFSIVWNTDVRAGLYGIQAALKTPMPKGSRVLIISSGAAVGGSPLSGGYAGAKRMLWFMASYANEVANKRSLGIHFQAILPMQIIGDTDLGRVAAGAYAQQKNMTVENFLSAKNGKPLSAKEYAANVVRLLADNSYARGIAYGIASDGITKLE
jgi:NAD(P)-dependent dehydrogenase (short-subunit alcohol dehydrogenase family)